MIKSSITTKGHVRIELRGETGELKEVRDIPNMVVTAGLTWLAAGLVAGTETIMSHMAVGTNAAAPALANTTLGTELARVALTSGTAVSGVLTYVASFPAGTGTGALVEAGIFNGTPAGTMLARTTFAVVNKGASDSITITWTITFS